ncbi:MAG TPA: hypothetical protein V6C71_09210 [Coleofasciculaceae cyanobacterium]|jgi:hypothetical protein
MKNVKLGKLWDSLHSSYWFLPTIFAFVAISLAFTMLWLDRLIPEKIGQGASQLKQPVKELPADFDEVNAALVVARRVTVDSDAYRVRAKSNGYLQG